jgi:hypothetical protein
MTKDCVYQIALNQKLPRITYTKQHYTKHYHVNSGSDVNFQVTLSKIIAQKEIA